MVERLGVAVVTGAARGIGRASAVQLAQAGWDVAGADVCAEVSTRNDYPPATRAELDETGRQVEAAGGRWLPLVFDQRDRAAVKTAFQQVVDAWGGIDVVHANAGIQAFVPILEQEDADWDDTIDTNLTGTSNVLRVAAPLLVARGGGRIVITSSTQGQHGTLNGSAYSASKWGLIGLMKSAALELGPHGITVNCLIPGLVDTVLTRHEQRYAQMIETGGGTPTGDEPEDEKTAAKGNAAKLPLRVPWIEPDDVAPIVVFLASPAARMISGGTFPATGGDSANFDG